MEQLDIVFSRSMPIRTYNSPPQGLSTKVIRK